MSNLTGFSEWLFTIAAGVLVCALLYVVISRSAKGAWVLVAALLTCLTFGRLDQLSEFKLTSTGLDATVRDARTATSEAKSATEVLRHLAVVMSSAIIRTESEVGMLDGMSARDRDADKANVLAQLRSLDLPNGEIMTVVDADAARTRADYLEMLRLRAITYNVPHDQAGAVQNAFQQLEQVFPAPLAADKVRAILGKYGVNDPDERSLLEDFAYFEKTGLQRRPDVWANRAKWGLLVTSPPSTPPKITAARP